MTTKTYVQGVKCSETEHIIKKNNSVDATKGATFVVLICDKNTNYFNVKHFILLFLIFLTSCTYNDMRKLFTDRPDAYTKFSGNFNYTKEQTEKAKNKIGLDFKKPLHETKDKKKLYYVGGSIYHNYDLFNNTYHVNGFGNLGVEF